MDHVLELADAPARLYLAAETGRFPDRIALADRLQLLSRGPHRFAVQLFRPAETGCFVTRY